MDRRVLKAQMADDNTPRTTVSFYKYFKIQNPEGFRDDFYQKAQSLGVLGRVYIAAEGINAQVSVPTENFNRFKSFLFSIPALDQVRLNTAVADDSHSFYMLKVKLRKKIVADGLDDESFNPADTGEYLSAQAFNELTDDPNTILVDMRNHYESEVGHFEGAILPDVDTFREELQVAEDLLKDNKDKNLVMYCTGGIRCEKASAYMKHLGFKNVYHLEGGIIKYARDAKSQGLKNKFKGVNFVFDERLAERISDDVIAQCHQCGSPFDKHTNCANLGCHILFIQCPQCKENYNNCCSEACKEVIQLPEEEQRKIRKGYEQKRNVFKKGRFGKL
ncbi:MAG: hypothetical protein RLZZ205_375 [Bacteroidota bacterium]|jgi:UPF0176 protein